MNVAYWPQGLQELAGIIGAEAALILAREAGGLKQYVPARAKPSHPWARLIGLPALEALCAARGGEQIEIPRGAHLDPLRPQILAMARQGLSRRAIARRLGCTERYARLVCNEAPSNQARLPGV